MPSVEQNQWLEAGVAAVRAGDKQTAHQLLLKVVDADERNEKAWLWLSAVVESESDRRICLENVLAINPNNKIALQALARESGSASPVAAGSSEVTTEPPPEKAHEQRAQVQPDANAQDDHRDVPFDDVWATEDDICAYCASRVQETDQACPQCGRSLITQEYRYKATANLHVYWVFLFTLGLIMFFQALYQFRIEQRLTGAAMHIALAGTLLVLVVGVYFRLLWAHLTSILVLILAAILSGANFLGGINPTVLSASGVDPAISGITTTFIDRVGDVLRIVQAVITGVSLFSAVFVVAPEFERTKERSIARTERGLHNAVDYHMVARRLMQEGKWASAVLHWQHAAALDRTAISYQRNLAKAYLRLGFIDRGLNVLQSAQKLPMQDGTRSEIEKLLRWAQQQATSKGS